MSFKPNFVPIPAGEMQMGAFHPSIGFDEQQDLIQQSNNAYRFNQDLISLEKLYAYVKSSESNWLFIKEELDPKWKEMSIKVQLAKENPETARPDLATAERLLANIDATAEALRSGQYQGFTRAIMPIKNKWFPDRTESIIKDPSRFINPEDILQKIQEMQQQPEAGHGVIVQIAPYNSYWGFFKLSRDEIDELADDNARDRINEVFEEKLERYIDDIESDIYDDIESRMEDDINKNVEEKYQEYLVDNELDEDDLTPYQIAEIRTKLEYDYRDTDEYYAIRDEIEEQIKYEYKYNFRRENYDDIFNNLVEEERDRLSDSSEYQTQEYMILINFPQEAWDDDEFTAFVQNMNINRHQISGGAGVAPMAFVLIAPKTPNNSSVSYNNKPAWIISQVQSDFCSKAKHVFDVIKSSIPQKNKSGYTEIRGLKEDVMQSLHWYSRPQWSAIKAQWSYSEYKTNYTYYLSPIYNNMYDDLTDEIIKNVQKIDYEDLVSGKYEDLDLTHKVLLLNKKSCYIGKQSCNKIWEAICKSIEIDGTIDINDIDFNSIAILENSFDQLKSIIDDMKLIYDNYQTRITIMKEEKFRGIPDPMAFINKYSHFINNWAQIAVTKVIALARKYGVSYVIMNSSESIQNQTEDGIPDMTADFIYDDTPKQLGFESKYLYSRDMWVRAAERMDARGRHVLADKLISKFISSLC